MVWVKKKKKNVRDSISIAASFGIQDLTLSGVKAKDEVLLFLTRRCN